MENEHLDDYQRDQLWRVSVETFYKVYYAESLTNSLIKSWQRWDEIAKCAIAITATTSAVSGWALWSLPKFRYKMEVDPNFAIEEFNDEFFRYRDQYSEGSKRLKNDILLTKRRRTKVQEELNVELRDLISTIEGV